MLVGALGDPPTLVTCTLKVMTGLPGVQVAAIRAGGVLRLDLKSGGAWSLTTSPLGLG
jgi:hypothetical protein